MRDLSTEPSPEKDFQLNLYIDGAPRETPEWREPEFG